ncbi:hypothetical protein [Embleya sp. NBC_00896]|uniref:hypothetical protein n=1 Tax=Embleya sp. NBC_00896 TaxID=2975961 RepID=UPI003870AB0C|nr:hypothetical protein OG928_02815 [Embleya sp. NBC_00896]
MAEIETAELRVPGAEEVIRAGKARGKRRRLLLASAVSACVLAGGGGTVIASSIVDENGESSAIISVDPGTTLPSTEPGSVVTEGTTRGQVWRIRSYLRADGMFCQREIEPTGVEGGGACYQRNPGERMNWSGSTEPNPDGTWSYQLNGTTSTAVDHLRITWDGAQAPVVVRSAPMTADIRVFHARVTAEGGSPKFTVTGYDAADRQLPSIDPPAKD